ncbi:MAG TPA: hypothetical protein VKQ36_15775 [Ktedonobacterales bacterium]|nr:hypothetical protein [Ktedonobacterales bacterium]
MLMTYSALGYALLMVLLAVLLIWRTQRIEAARVHEWRHMLAQRIAYAVVRRAGRGN